MMEDLRRSMDSISGRFYKSRSKYILMHQDDVDEFELICMVSEDSLPNANADDLMYGAYKLVSTNLTPRGSYEFVGD
jgi:thermostable 8-oxoguanine DNA glycosylase